MRLDAWHIFKGGYGLWEWELKKLQLICKLESVLLIISVYDVTILIDIKCIILHTFAHLCNQDAAFSPWDSRANVGAGILEIKA